jgi:hypothetical protein
MIWELKQYINIAKADIYEREYTMEFEDGEETKKYESIEEYNTHMEFCENIWGNHYNTPRFHSLILMKIFNYEYYDSFM